MKIFSRVCLLAFLLCGSPFVPGQNSDEYFLLPGPTVSVAVGDSVKLELTTIGLDGSFNPALMDAVDWTINGKDRGQLDPSEGRFLFGLPPSTGTYTAPHTVPKINPVAVAISFQPSPTNKTKITLVCNIKVVDRSNFFQLSGKSAPEGTFELDDRFSAPAVRNMLAHATIAGPEMMITVGSMQPGGAGGGERTHSNGSMNLFIAGSGPGQYAWTLPGSAATSVMLTIASSSGADMYSTGDCLPHGSNDCKAVSTSGSTRVTSYDPKTGEVDGEFRGTVVKLVNGKPSTYAFASGGFRVNVQAMGGGFHP